AAAIAAGETPSPAMVAAASDRGELSSVAAWTLLAIHFAALILFSTLTARTTLYRRIPLKSPDVLHERVAEVLNATGQVLPRADWSSIYFTDTEHLRWSARHGAAGTEMSPLLLLYRQSPRP